MMNGVALIVSFFGGLALAALVAYFIFKNAVASRVAQAREQLRSELEQLKYEKAGLEKDLVHAGEKIQEQEKELEEARQEARREIQDAKDEAAKALEAAKED